MAPCTAFSLPRKSSSSDSANSRRVVPRRRSDFWSHSCHPCAASASATVSGSHTGIGWPLPPNLGFGLRPSGSGRKSRIAASVQPRDLRIGLDTQTRSSVLRTNPGPAGARAPHSSAASRSSGWAPAQVRAARPSSDSLVVSPAAAQEPLHRLEGQFLRDQFGLSMVGRCRCAHSVPSLSVSH